MKRCDRPHRISVVAGLLLFILAGAALNAQRVIDRPLKPAADGLDGVPATLMLPREVVDDRFLWRVGVAASTPTGFEGLPGATRRRPVAFRRLPIEGLTMRDAIEALVESDPRYMWSEDSGVVVVRPVIAWSNARNPLNQRTGHVDWVDISPEDALKRIVNIIYGEPPSATGPVTSATDRRVSIQIESGTVIELLNALVRADGWTTWSATYPEDEPDIRFRLTLHLGSGSGAHSHAIGRPRLPPSLAPPISQ